MSKSKRILWVTVAGALGLLAWYVLSPQDKITLSNQSGIGQAVVLLDGWRSSCLDDEIERGNVASVGNMTPDPSCLSEIAVFSQGNAMKLLTPVTSWTPAPTDVVPVALSGLLDVPLTVWTLTGIPNDGVVNTSRANAIYNQMGAGFAFQVDPRDRHAQTEITVASCEELQPLKDAFEPTSQRINVYYVPRVTAPLIVDGATIQADITGRWCEDDPNIVLIGPFAAETLAHELGHALSLGHTDQLSLPTSNLMYSWSTYRDSLTTGQVFRANVNKLSRVNKNNVRSGPTWDCPDSQADRRCPALAFDVQPK